MSSYNRTIYDADPADTASDGKHVRIVKRRENNTFEIESPEAIATLSVEQALALRASLTEAIDHA